MVDTRIEEEIERLSEDTELFDLESLITDGVDAKIPVAIEYQGKTFGAMIRPLNNIEWNNATRKALKNDNTSNEVEIVKKALYKKDGSEFPADVVEKLPTGIVNELMKEISRISGVKLNTKENMELMKELMGF